MWLVWLILRLAGIALISGVLWYPQVDQDIFVYHFWSTQLYAGHLPWRGFNVEYPPGVFLGMLLPGGKGAFELEFLFLAMLADGYIAKALWRHRPGGLGAWCWVLVPIALGPIMWVRYDIFVAAALVGLVVNLRKEHWRRAGACLAAAALIKLWPIALVLVLWRLIPADGRRRFAGWTTGICVGACIPVVAWGGLPGLHWMLHYQGDRGLELETAWALPIQLAHSFNLSVRLLKAHDAIEYPLTGFAQTATSAVVPLLLLLLAVVVWFDSKRRFTYATATLLTIAVVIFGEKVLSAQYVVWGAAAVAVALDDLPLRSLRHRWHLILATLAWGITTQLFFPFYEVYVFYGWFRGDLVAILHAEAVFVWVGVASFYVLRRPKFVIEPDVPEPRTEEAPVAQSRLADAPV